MKAMRFAQFILVLLTVILLVSVFAISAMAIPPEPDAWSWEEDFLLIACDDFDVRNHSIGSLHQKKYFDQDGTPLRIKGHNEGLDHVYNASDPDKYLESTYAGNYTFDLTTEQEDEVVQGVGWHITVPGYGLVYYWSGHYELVDGEIVLARGHNNLDELEIFCELLK